MEREQKEASLRQGKSLRRSVEDEAAGMRLEHYLRQNLGFTKAQIRGMKFRENGLVLNGSRVRVSQTLQRGDVLEIQLEKEEMGSNHLEAAEGTPDILYEDADLLAVWKESGLALHPAHGHYRDTLSNQVHAYFQSRGEQVRIRSIGRLDKDTSGIIVFAKNQVAAARLWQQKEEGVFWKEYLAVCRGNFACGIEQSVRPAGEEFACKAEQGVQPAREDFACGIEQKVQPAGGWQRISAPIAPLPGDKMKMCVSPEGKPAVTYFRILRQTEDAALLQVRIETGRTHQIRVHMASIGHPVEGDILYGRESLQGDTADRFNIPGRLKLCAWRTELLQPFSGEKIVISRADR
ncbi:MAG: RluA family pseudouridine synthase [Lachnospiraceae bacterium]|nr:RluA family pseudouridine synthase [Lachnospiraceae bacterium]